MGRLPRFRPSNSSKVVFRRKHDGQSARQNCRPGARSAPTEKIYLAERNTQVAKQVVRGRDVKEEVRKRESQQITATCENPLSITELRDQLGVCICFECGRWHRREKRDCRADSRLQILKGSFAIRRRNVVNPSHPPGPQPRNAPPPLPFSSPPPPLFSPPHLDN